MSTIPKHSIGSRPKDLYTRINIRIRNVRFETLRSTLDRYPKTLLGSEEKRQVYYNETTDEMVFDRSIVAFDAILFYYQSEGILMRPPFVAMEEFLKECNFFELDCNDIRRMKESENYSNHNKPKRTELADSKVDDEVLEHLTDSREHLKISAHQDLSSVSLYSRKVWNFLEEPSSSMFASIFAIFSFSLISVSVVLSCVLTIPEIQRRRNLGLFQDPWALMELTLNSYFALEYFLRLIVSPNLIKLLISPLNLIDLLAFSPYFVVLLTDSAKMSSLSFLRMLRMVRVLRLLRLSKQSKKVATVIEMIKRSIKDVFTLVLCYFISAVVFGSLQYYVEAGTANTPFTSIPQSMWWAFQTVIPIGYGDIVPSGLRGKLIGGSVAVIGAVTLTIPLLHLGGKFLIEYADFSGINVGRDCKLPIELR